MARGKHAKMMGRALRRNGQVKAPERRMVTAVGYPLALAAACALALGPSYAIAAEADADAAPSASETRQIDSNSVSDSMMPVASSKDETVYVFAKADGSVKNVEVSDKLTNSGKVAELADSSTLTGIENVEGDESFRGTGANMVWSADGNDIYYRGDSDKELPISMSVAYKLDGKAVSADDMAGKSGKVEISYSFQNKTDAENGVQVPLAAITGMLFDNDSFSNIEIDNGKVVDDGDRVVVVGYAMPGLAKSLDVSADTLDIPSGFTVTADATSFELNSTLTMVTGNLFDSVSMDDFDTDGLDGASGELQDAMSQLIDGADQLADGAGQLADGTATMQDKVSDLPAGVEKLYAGSSSLAKGLSAAPDGAGQLANGASQLSSGTDQLLNGEDGEGGLTAAQAGARQLASGLSTLPSTMSELNSGFTSIKDAAALIQSKATEAAQLIGAAGSDVSSAGDSLGDAQTALQALLTAHAINPATDEDAQKLASALSSAGTSLSSAGTSLTTAGGDLASSDPSDYGAIALSMGISSGVDDAQGKIASKSSELQAAVEGSASLADGLDEAVTGTKKLNAGASQLSSGASELTSKLTDAANGASALNKGLKTLNGSTGSLIAGVKQLVDGTAKLADGSDSLLDGLKQFDDEGISKIIEFLDSDLLQAAGNLDAVRDAGESYTNFSGITKGTEGSVKFVIETDAIES